MAKSTTNNVANVSAAKGIKGGYIFSAPVGSVLPEKPIAKASELDEAFECLGFISEDGIELSEEQDSDQLNDAFGDMMDETYSNRVESSQLTFAEIKASTLKRQYGPGNVSDENGVITVKHNSDNHPEFAYVLLLMLKDNRKWTHVVPRGKSSELDSLTISSSELCQRAITLKYLTDDAGQTCYDYIDSTETEAA